MNLLLIAVKRKRHYALIKDFNTFKYDHTLHRRRKYVCRHCLQDFSIEEILKRHIKDCFKINSKKRIIIPKICKYDKFKNYIKKVAAYNL